VRATRVYSEPAVARSGWGQRRCLAPFVFVTEHQKIDEACFSGFVCFVGKGSRAPSAAPPLASAAGRPRVSGSCPAEAAAGVPPPPPPHQVTPE
jgi:hypothetical protein